MHFRTIEAHQFNKGAPIICVFDHVPTADEVMRGIAGIPVFNTPQMVETMRQELANFPKPADIEIELASCVQAGLWPSMGCLTSDRKMILAICLTTLVAP
jgi:hypothetical protein